ncbi:MAG: ATP-dependent helicase C-terminal domain-containing protein, partial [Bdellovibrionota bacterium]
EGTLTRLRNQERPWGTLLDRMQRIPKAAPEQIVLVAQTRLLRAIAETGFTAAKDVAEAVDWRTLLPEIAGINPEEVERMLPEKWQLPSGRQVEIHYPDDGSPPLAESYLQDFFGLSELPVLARGALKLTVRLLGPNKRPLQITQDLKSFWANTYPALKKELARNYPRHHWPDDPLAAKAALLKRHL